MELAELLANQLAAERARANDWQKLANQRAEEILRLQQEIQDLKDELHEEPPQCGRKEQP